MLTPFYFLIGCWQVEPGDGEEERVELHQELHRPRVHQPSRQHAHTPGEQDTGTEDSGEVGGSHHGRGVEAPRVYMSGKKMSVPKVCNSAILPFLHKVCLLVAVFQFPGAFHTCRIVSELLFNLMKLCCHNGVAGVRTLRAAPTQVPCVWPGFPVFQVVSTIQNGWGRLSLN